MMFKHAAGRPPTFQSPARRIVPTAVAGRGRRRDTTTALVTGSASQVADVGPALEKEGFSTRTGPSDALHLLEEIRHAALPSRSLDCYVQLPSTELIGDRRASPGELRALVANALLARFDAFAVVAPLLAPGARLVIVAGDRAGTTRDTDLGLPAISAVLAEAVLASNGAHSVRTTVIGAACTAADIAAIARGDSGDRSPGVSLADYAAVSPELSYVEWRDEMLGLAGELSNGHG